MPPLPLNAQGRTLRAGADALGWDTQTVPLLINSVPYNGRAACIHCQHCVGFACPTDAKNGTQNTLIPRALAIRELHTRNRGDGRADRDRRVGPRGRRHLLERAKTERVTAHSEVVVVSGGAIETARLLLNSKSAAHPHGLGNAHDQVGRNLQGHYYAGAVGWMPEPIWDGIGPGATTATIRFNHWRTTAIVGGGMLADDFIMLPLSFLKGRVPARCPALGPGAQAVDARATTRGC